MSVEPIKEQDVRPSLEFFGETLKMIREHMRFNKSELGKIMGYNGRSCGNVVSKVENGTANIHQVVKYVDALQRLYHHDVTMRPVVDYDIETMLVMADRYLAPALFNETL